MIRSKRSISKVFHKDTELGELFDWFGDQLPNEEWNHGEMNFLKQKICVTINLDPDKRGSMIPEGGKESHRSNGKGKG